MAVTRILHQFPLSHFCEKTRWNLDTKGLGYRLNNQFPGLHAAVNQLTSGCQTVPILRDGKRAIGDSTQIALYLEESYSGQPLLPARGAERARALELDRYFSATFGPEVRRLCYGEALRHAKAARTMFFRGYGPLLQRLGAGLPGMLLERQLYKMYQLDDAGLRTARGVLQQALTRLEAELGNDTSRYLVGDQLSLADICAAALLAPLVGPFDSPWTELPVQVEALHTLRAQLRQRAAGSWVLWLYARDRRVAARAQGSTEPIN